MKPYLLTHVAALALLTGGTAMAQSESFSAADMDGDGALSHQEADQALPGLDIPDSNDDGVVNKDEVEEVLPELSFTGNGSEAVGPQAYRRIIQHLNDA